MAYPHIYTTVSVSRLVFADLAIGLRLFDHSKRGKNETHTPNLTLTLTSD